jgi:hypothetical protein
LGRCSGNRIGAVGALRLKNLPLPKDIFFLKVSFQKGKINSFRNLFLMPLESHQIGAVKLPGTGEIWHEARIWGA